MAYKNIVKIACVDKADLFTRLRDFLSARNATHDYLATGIGWTLIDASYAVDENSPQLGDWFVIYSSGESGREDHYYKVEWASGLLKVSLYWYWDAVAHSGSYVTFGNILTVVESSGTYELSVWGDLDFVTTVFFQGVTTYAGYFGRVANDLYDDSVAICSAALTAGTDVVVALDVVPASWQVGTTVYLRHQGTIEVAVLKAVTANSITVDLANSYPDGCKVQAQLGCVVNNNGSTVGCSGIGQADLTVKSYNAYLVGGLVYLGPDAVGNWLASPWLIAITASFRGTLPHIMGITQGALASWDLLGPDENGDYWRYVDAYSNLDLVIREVV